MLFAIETKNLGKTYQRKLAGKPRYGALRDSLTNWWKSYTKNRKDTNFWALKNLDLEVEAGEVLGIIGPNGAGKSTLLKLLTRITEPSTGSFKLRGRVSSLLEVGTGFHPELTGRENIYLSGTILGMRRTEIKTHFDEIVAFAGIADFLDMPVKRFSSGMYVRLGFAVAAHLNAEILLVDEVLAVGDAEFQRKCLTKMDEAAHSGRTVLLVSHNLDVISSLSSRVCWLDKGEMKQIGPAPNIIQSYLQSLDSKVDAPIQGGEIMKDIQMFVQDKPQTWAQPSQEIEFRVGFQSPQAIYNPVLGFTIRNAQQLPLASINNRHYNVNFPTKAYHQGEISVGFSAANLLPGRYFVDLFFGDKTGDVEKLPNAFSFRIMADSAALPVVETMPQQLNLMLLSGVRWDIKEGL